jgi:predicted DNA-binding ribbon-helix-helix protein
MTANGGGGQKRVTRGERPRHSFRCDTARWAAFKAAAARRGETVTKVLIRKIDEYLGEPD